MADRENPAEHSDIGERKQPLSPQLEGIDPLTEGDKLLPREEASEDEQPKPKKKRPKA